ncbi:MAG TPA: TonB-dependent receptor [Terriglobia bacterium]|nr:TonB-dependent receptor [Terriglobia bacterium]
MSFRPLISALVFSLFTIALAPAARGQGVGGVLSGAVRDSSGAPMPGVHLTVRNVSTGAARMVTTGSDGLYTAAGLPPGTYELTAAAPGFSTEVRSGITVAVGARPVENFVLQPGKRVIRTSAAPAAVNQGTSTVSGNVSAATVRNSPLNGRDWTQLATLQPGVSSIQTANTGQGSVAQHGFGAAMSISGGRPEQNNYRLDGISINDYSNGAPGSVLGANLGVDAVQQFSVLQSNYPAEYGRTSGGVINAATRAGTNAFHGSVYEFLRNSALDARNFFDAAIPPFRRNQFGASLGGPIRRGRTFFFADYEGLRQSLGITHVDTVPSAAARQGNLSTGAVEVSPAVAPFLSAFYPLPNGPLLGSGDTAIFTFAGQQLTTENFFTAKINHRFSDRDNLAGTYLRDNSKIVQPDAFDELLSNVVSHRQIVVLQEQHVLSPSTLNVARFGFNRAVAVDGGLSKVLNPRLQDASFAMIPGQFVGAITVPGLTPFDGGPSVTLGTLSGSKRFAWNSFQGSDDVFVTRGAQALQFGAVVERMQDNVGIISNTNGAFGFSSLAAFLTDQPRTFEGLVPSPIGVFGARQTLFGVYLQDDIRARPNLTVNLGLRYEMATVPTEAHNRISNLQALTDSQPRLGAPYFLNPTLHNFEPRLGFAWSPSGNGKSAVRGGFGVFDVLPLPYEFNIITPLAAPFSEVVLGTTLPAGSFPTGAFTQLASDSSAFRASYVEHNPQRNYVLQWNLNVERELAPNLVATVGYVGSRAVHQPFRMDDFDTVLPALTPAGYLYPPTATSLRLNPNFGRISGIVWQGNAFYDALEVVLAKSLSHGLQLHGAYTWGKSIDTSSVTITSDQLDNSLVNVPFFDPRVNRGPSDFNIAQNFVANFTWSVPSPRLHSNLQSQISNLKSQISNLQSQISNLKSPISNLQSQISNLKSPISNLKSQISNLQSQISNPLSRFGVWALSGWQLGGIYKASTGVPFTPILGGDPLGTKLTDVSELPNLVVAPGCGTPVNSGNPTSYIKTQCFTFPSPASLRGNLGRNRLTGPGLSSFDFSLFKNNSIKRVSEGLNVQFRAEFFNVFNRANFSPPLNNLAVFDQSGNPVPGAGLITSTTAPSREIQLALKVIW